MTSELLQKLKNLQRVRGDVSPFSSPLEYETWTDEVAPLLSFNEKLQNSFKYDVKIAKFKSKTGSPNIDQINETIGILNQAVTLLEINPVPNSAPNPTTDKPNKISDWHKKPLGITWLAAAGTVLGAIIVYLFRSKLGIPL